MKKYIKGLFAICVVFALTAAGVYAETTATTSTAGKTSYDYQTNKVGITDTVAFDTQELTVLVVKGDYTGNSTEAITSEDVYYVDQESGSAFSCFQNLGLKQANLEAGKYTLIAGGENVAEPIKELMIIGNVADKVPGELTKENLNFGTVSDVKKIKKNENDYVYVCKCVMPKGTVSDSSKMGFIFQRKKDNQWQHLYKTMDLSKLNTVSIDANIEFGLQVNGINVDPDTIQFSAIPYAEKSTTTETTTN